MKHCRDHKCIKDKVDKIGEEKALWHRITHNKWFFWAMTGVIGLFLAYNLWVTKEIFAQKANDAADKVTVKEIDKTVKEIKEQSEKRDEKREQDKQEIMKMLLEIQKQIKK
jgi:esterase/lipase